MSAKKANNFQIWYYSFNCKLVDFFKLRYNIFYVGENEIVFTMLEGFKDKNINNDLEKFSKFNEITKEKGQICIKDDKIKYYILDTNWENIDYSVVENW